MSIATDALSHPLIFPLDFNISPISHVRAGLKPAPTVPVVALSHPLIFPRATKGETKRRYDGWNILIAHPMLTGKPASELCKLYRAKDAIEKDFPVIKSFTELHPVRHRTDDKVRAHVTICMLALLLERTLHKLLSCHVRDREKSTESLSAIAALELLEPCRLNCYAPTDGGPPAYLLTTIQSEQQHILAGLKMTHLAQDEYLAELLEKGS